jgi:hypothetical protein
MPQKALFYKDVERLAEWIILCKERRVLLMFITMLTNGGICGRFWTGRVSFLKQLRNFVLHAFVDMRWHMLDSIFSALQNRSERSLTVLVVFNLI